MSDSRPPRFSGEPREPGPAALALGDLIDGAVRRIITAIVIAGGLIAIAIWSQEGAAPRYQVTAADGRIIRVNTESGTVIACDVDRPGERCAIVLQRGQSLDDELPARVEARPAPALPAPAPAAANEAAAAPAAR